MRIGLYGSIANNMYCLTKVLRSQGYDAEYIHNPSDTYPFSQPLWEDVDLTLGYDRVTERIPDVTEWERIAAMSGWTRPSWVVEPPATPIGIYAAAKVALKTFPPLPGYSRPQLRQTLGYIRSTQQLAQHMATYDWLIVCGVGVVAAYFSKKPYLYWPHGGDVRVLPLKKDTPFDRWFATLLRKAAAKATIKGSHDPTLVDCMRGMGVPGPFPYLPFIVDTEKYAPQPETDEGLLPAEVLERAKGKRVLLLSSRQDFRWKGTDQFLKAFVKAVREEAHLFLIISRWGPDAPKAEAMLREGGVQDSVYYLDHVLSKPLLIRFYNLADVVVDQFLIAAHGTTMLEAMACETPVMIKFESSRFVDYWPDYKDPPIINVGDEEAIFRALCDISAGKLDLKGMGIAARRWVEEHHGPSQTSRYLLPQGAKEYAHARAS